LTGGDGVDQVFGEAGDHTFVWNHGDDTDPNEGGTGTDTILTGSTVTTLIRVTVNQ